MSIRSRLTVLVALAAAPPAPTVVTPAAAAPAAATSGESDPIDRLAAWLLQQAQVAPAAPGH